MKYVLAAAAAALLPLLPSISHAQTAAGLKADDLKPATCSSCAEWSKPHQPFNIYGNTWYVGPAGLSSVLITGPQGHILVDGTVPQAAQQIEANIEALGFRIGDVKLIVNSHPHLDHAAGIAYLARRSGARVAAGAAAAPVLEAGVDLPGDPQYEDLRNYPFPKVAHVHGVQDGETLSVGPLRITAHLTPGHTPGGTTWSWRSCEVGAGGSASASSCRDVVFLDSLTAMSTPDFRFTGDAHHPDRTASFRASIDKVAALPCDIAVSAHPGFTGVLEKAAARTPDKNPFIDPNACRAYAEEARKGFEERVAKERAETK